LFLPFVSPDFGVDHLEDIIEKTTFPWLLSNITDKLNSSPLANGKVKELLQWGNIKVSCNWLIYLVAMQKWTYHIVIHAC